MSERLVVRLGSHAQQPIPWVTWSDEQQGVISSGVLQEAEALASLAERAGGRPVDVLVDSSAIHFSEVTLPAKAQRQAMKALPFMLEESLAQDVEMLHFVPGPRNGDQLSVAVVSHSQMGLWQSWLAEAGLPCTRMVPDLLALPLIPDTALSLLQLEDQLLLRSGPAKGMILEPEWLAPLLPQLGVDPQLPWATFTPTELPEEVVPLQQTLELPMQWLAQGFGRAPINLMTGNYAPAREFGKAIQTWAKVGIAASVLLVLGLVHNALTLRDLNQERDALRAEQVQIYRTLFPNETRVLNPRSQLNAKLRAAGGGGGDGGELLAMLDKLAPAFAAQPEVRPEALRFDAARGEVRLQLAGRSFAQFEQFREEAGRHFNVETGALNNDEEGVTGSVTVRVK
ncbi:type II secretion system protein GspL [Ferrimonas marina]|uniref:Type II secretion system protein L n=1 Tax=Ferrimonas marina TaxID=299255 RepID=A0A1M5Z8S4_9GAMM|nr:type II secretion system protein GspL [Ferrimonas marina]SHI20601.1 general secretion pathway protein L [Ferrimonas marina]